MGHASKKAGMLYGLAPSRTLDMQLTTSELAINMACRLGVDVMDAGGPCKYCGMQLDAKGIHAHSCMAGADAIWEHNAVR